MANELPVTTTRKSIAYPSPWFDVASRYVPKHIKELFKFTKYHFVSSSIIYPIVTKMSEYPVTGFIYNNVSDTLEKSWKHVLEETIDLKSFLISVHQDVFVYGNAFVLMHYPFIRYLISPSGKRYKAEDLDYKMKIEQKKWSFYGIDPELKQEVQFKVQDLYVANKSMFKLSKISPEFMDIQYNTFTGDKYYYYNVPLEDKKKILASTKVYLDTTPSIIFDAIAQNKQIQLDDNHFFHFERPTIANLWPGWGTPALVPVLKDIHYFSVLRKANEALALQRIVPLMILFPQQNADITPFKSVNLQDWKRRVEDELLHWRRDPNYIPVMPLPIGQELIGGDARNMMVTQEMDFVAKGIAASLGVPIEFIQGGLNYSGSSVSLRILENTFIKQREEDLEFINNFLIPRISKYFKLPKIDIALKTFKMADDVQFQQIMVNLMQNGFVSRKRVLDQWDINSHEEYAQQKKEHAELSAIQRDDLISQAEVQSLVGAITARGQAMAQFEAQKMQQELASELNETGDGTVDTQIAAMDVAHKYAAQILSLPPESAQGILEKMKSDMPTLYELVIQAIQEMQSQASGTGDKDGKKPSQAKKADDKGKRKPGEKDKPGASTQPSPQAGLAPIGGKIQISPGQGQQASGGDMRPLPTQKPPRRTNSPV